jgi:hypothetical protein
VHCAFVGYASVPIQGGYLERKDKHKPYDNPSHAYSARQHYITTTSSSSSSGSGSWLQLLTSAAVNATAAFTSAAAAANSDASLSIYSSSSSSSGAAGMADITGINDGGGFGNFSDVIHTNLDLLTLGNVYPGSKRMWVHLASVYVITLVALKVR